MFRARDAHILFAGASALRIIADQVRGLAAIHEQSEDLWLTIRDLEGLADRLGDPQRRLFGGFVGGQDLGVLQQLLDEGVVDRAGRRVSIAALQRSALTDLRELLESVV